MEKGMDKIKGIIPLASMPFKENGEVDYDAFERLLNYMLWTGVDGIGLWGMMSEYYKLSDYERDVLASIYFRTVNPSPAHSLVSVTDWSTEIAVRHAKQYEDAGAEILMLLPPFYYKPTKEDIVLHIESVVSSVSIPVLVQYAPQSTGMVFEDEIIFRFAEKYPNIAFKLEANPQEPFIKHYLDHMPDLKVMSGYGGLDMPDLLNIGVRGTMPGCSFEDIHVEIYRRFCEGDLKGAEELFLKMKPFLEYYMTSVEKLIACEKEILRRRNVINNNVCRHPGYSLTEQDMNMIDGMFEELSGFLPAYK